MEKNQIGMLISEGVITEVVEAYLQTVVFKVPMKIVESAMQESGLMITVRLGEEPPQAATITKVSDFERLREQVLAQQYAQEKVRQAQGMQNAYGQSPQQPVDVQDPSDIFAMLDRMNNHQGFEE